MKHFKILGLLAVTAATTMSFAASASADYVTTNTGGVPSTPNFHLVNEGGHIEIANAIADIMCSSTIEGVPNTHGAGENVSGPFTTFSLTGCTNSWHVTIVSAGSFSIESTSGHNGTLFSSGLRIDATRFGITCVYETNNTHMATVTGGNPATLHIEEAIPFDVAASSSLCRGGSTEAEWDGSYVTTSSLYVGNS